MTTRRDQLSECNTEKQPLADFQAGWCARCVNPECTRSLYGQSRFDLRVNSWEDRLFRNPPRMDSSDPRYRDIAGKRFLTVDVGPAPEVRTWIDPMQSVPERSAPKPVPMELRPEPIVSPAPLQPEPTVVQPEPVTSLPVAPTPEPSGKVRPEFVALNSISQGGRMLAGVRKEERPARDPWAVPEVAENVIPVGGRVRLGRSEG